MGKAVSRTSESRPEKVDVIDKNTSGIKQMYMLQAMLSVCQFPSDPKVHEMFYLDIEDFEWVEPDDFK